MTYLKKEDLAVWSRVVTSELAAPETLMAWLEGPLRTFFPYSGVILGHGELVAGQLKVTHMLATGHEDRYLDQIATTFELVHRGSLKWWFAHRQPFVIDPHAPPDYTSAFELQEIETFGLGLVAGHGVLNIKGNAGTYFGFTGVHSRASSWHLDALRLIAPVLNALFLAHCAQSEALLSSSALLDSLTWRQKCIVRCLAQGMDNKTIASELGIALKTVRNQLTDIYAQLNLRSRTHLLTLVK